MGNETAAKAAEKPKNRGAKVAVPAKAATPWGDARVVEEARVVQRVGDKRFATIIQLLEDKRGEQLVRLAYTTDGVARRGPVTLRPRDVEKLRSALAPGSALAAAFGWPPAPSSPNATDDAGGEA